MAKEYSITKSENLNIINNLMSTYGVKMELTVLNVNQQNKYQMLLGALPVSLIALLLRRIPRDYANPEGVQRALVSKKIQDIRKDFSTDSSSFTFPNGLVGVLDLDKDSKSKFIKLKEQEQHLTFVVELEEMKQALQNMTTVEGDFLSEADAEKFYCGTLVDGHHRLIAMMQETNYDFQFPICLVSTREKKTISKLFIQINENQTKPSSVHTLAMREMAGAMDKKEATAQKVLNELNSKPKGVLENRIKIIDAKRPAGLPPTYITNYKFVKLYGKYIDVALADSLTDDNKAELLNRYFEAWSIVFKEAWNDHKKHVLVKAMGFEIMMRLFDSIYKDGIVPIKGKGNLFSTKECVEVINKYFRTSLSTYDYHVIITEDATYVDTEARIHSGNTTLAAGEFILDFSSEKFGSFSNGKGLNQLTNILEKHISNVK